MDNTINDNETELKETLGNLLKRTRAKQKKTLEDVNESTKIHLTSLEALENDDFEALPAEVFLRGFIKLYAGYLGLDPEDTIRHYKSQISSEQEEFSDNPTPRDILAGETLAESTSFFRKNSKVITVSLLLAILLLFYGLGIFFKSSDTKDDIQPAMNNVEPLTNETPPIDQQADAEVRPLDEEQEKSEEPLVTPKPSTTENTSNPKPPTAVEPVVKSTPEPPPVAIEIPEKTRQSLKVTQETTLPRTVKVSTAPPMSGEPDNLNKNEPAATISIPEDSSDKKQP